MDVTNIYELCVFILLLYSDGGDEPQVLQPVLALCCEPYFILSIPRHWFLTTSRGTFM